MEKRTTKSAGTAIGKAVPGGGSVASVRLGTFKSSKRAPKTGKAAMGYAMGKGKPATSVGLRARAGDKSSMAGQDVFSPVALYGATGFEIIEIIRKGVPATALKRIALGMGIPKERLYTTLCLHRSSVERKIRENAVLSPEQSERVLGLERLIGQVEVMVEQSGNPKGFDPTRWVSAWLERSLPALGGAKPADFMDTMQGQDIVSRLLAQSQSGAYA